jgi:GH24 family phage-related lysozyme (muramidase)
MDITDKIKSHVKLKEGLRLDVYADTRGFLTVGYGHKVNANDQLKLGDKITQQKADNIFEHDFFWMISNVKQLVENFDTMPDNVQIALVDMAYNNGIGGLKQYKKFLHYVNLREWSKAADEIVDSANYRSRDLSGRYKELEKMVREAK